MTGFRRPRHRRCPIARLQPSTAIAPARIGLNPADFGKVSAKSCRASGEYLGKGGARRLRVDHEARIVAGRIERVVRGQNLAPEQPAQPSGIQIAALERFGGTIDVFQTPEAHLMAAIAAPAGNWDVVFVVADEYPDSPFDSSYMIDATHRLGASEVVYEVFSQKEGHEPRMKKSLRPTQH